MHQHMVMCFLNGVIVLGLIILYAFIIQVLGSRGDMESKIEATTRVKLKELETNMSKNKEVALKRLLDIVLDIKPELHENWKK